MPREAETAMRSVKTLLLGLGAAIAWPAYLILLAYAARVGPWPRTAGRPAAFVLASLAAAGWAAGVSRFLFRPGGWAEEVLRIPAAAARQLRLGMRVLLGAAVVLLIPRALLDQGLIAPAENPVQAPEVCRLLEMAFGVVAWLVIFRLGRGKAVRAAWSSDLPPELGWLGRHRRVLLWSLLLALASTIALDAVGYGFTARRISRAGRNPSCCWRPARRSMGWSRRPSTIARGVGSVPSAPSTRRRPWRRTPPSCPAASATWRPGASRPSGCSSGRGTGASMRSCSAPWGLPDLEL